MDYIRPRDIINIAFIEEDLRKEWCKLIKPKENNKIRKIVRFKNRLFYNIIKNRRNIWNLRWNRSNWK